jgi:hypothetical protein
MAVVPPQRVTQRDAAAKIILPDSESEQMESSRHVAEVDGTTFEQYSPRQAKAYEAFMQVF